MTTFGNYSRYYNLLYKDKDYKGEARFISNSENLALRARSEFSGFAI